MVCCESKEKKHLPQLGNWRNFLGMKTNELHMKGQTGISQVWSRSKDMP